LSGRRGKLFRRLKTRKRRKAGGVGEAWRGRRVVPPEAWVRREAHRAAGGAEMRRTANARGEAGGVGYGVGCEADGAADAAPWSESVIGPGSYCPRRRDRTSCFRSSSIAGDLRSLRTRTTSAEARS
jgi:hypothetical protein